MYIKLLFHKQNFYKFITVFPIFILHYTIYIVYNLHRTDIAPHQSFLRARTTIQYTITEGGGKTGKNSK